MDVTNSFIFLLQFFSIFAVHLFNQGSAAPEDFKITVKEKTVEHLAVKSATKKPGLLNKIVRKVSKKLSICGSDPIVKIEFCRRFLPIDDLGLTFDNLYGEELNCNPKTFHKRHPQSGETDNYVIDMYSCPELFYYDLETETDTSISHNYHVSNGVEYNSAIVYIQKNTVYADEKIYPRYYVKEIVFENFVPSQSISNNSLETPTPRKNSDSNFVESQAVAYDEARKLNKPYEKFQKNFFSINVCGLRRLHKIQICRESIRSSYRWYARFLHQGYDEYLCRKRRIQVAIPDDNDHTDSKNVYRYETEITFLLCPRIIQVFHRNEDFVYLSSNLRPRSVFLFTRKNERGEPFVRRFLVDGLNVEKIAQDQRRERFMLYPSAEEREEELRESRKSLFKNLEQRTSSVQSTVRTPAMIARFKPIRSSKSLLLRRLVSNDDRKYVVEDSLISFSQIKTTKLVYMRFKMTHWSFDICQQPKLIRRQLCYNILRQPPYNFQMDTHEINVNYKCNKRTVHLKVREIEYLQPMDFSMWSCPKPSIDVQYNFYIAKSPLRNSALVLKTSHLHPDSDDSDIYPDALVTGIDSDYLSKIKELHK